MTSPFTPALELISSCVVGGLDLDVGLDATGAGYVLHSDTRAQRSVQWRKQTVENNWVEGSFDISAVRANVIEPVSVWVHGSSNDDMQRRLSAVTDALAQPAFQVTWITGGTSKANGTKEVWDCSYSDYSIESSGPMQVALLSLLKISLNRRPRVTRTYSDGTTYVA